MAARIEFRVGAGQLAPQIIHRSGAALPQEYLLMTYPVMVTASGWTEANLFRDIYGGHNWHLVRHPRDFHSEGERYLLSPGLGAAEAKSLAIDLLYRLNNRERGVRKPVTIATCDDCGATHVWGGGDSWTEYLPFWCWHCHTASRKFTILP